jgi:hypothetical protein
MTIYAIITVSIGLTCAAIALYFKAYRLLRQDKLRLSASHRRSKEHTLWERGQLPIKVNQNAHSGLPDLGRRGFLPRLAFFFLCAIGARAAARGDALPAVEDFLTTLPGPDHSPNTPSEQCSHSDLSINHIDVYGPEGSHFDRPASHNDHTDCPHDDQPPHNDHNDHHDHHDKPHVDAPHGDHGDLARFA